ncbi:hypothetical protein LMJF_30_1860 [Leishmania major strain Friedlin]|uniref:Uncharacterized protein n=1 Tax=Leishmania major TaxID=5664 RepID=Q4Q7A9_LEIMA|nr:hypothetical protein LMJF_30_1860 [Leishmania major strain Friedlin]CAG9578418.1 hypothetical_protein_-_conserved [Leishmania major strain Friedlin]CAJ06347.1 hypothetical protein LMJF_30_1860 [Leishmania major strain Friedlin]|eukprot:XP_001684789.1 hypothetical protein LMJF_30_1860 [Leishmania major strain Friedlin]
MTVRELAKGAMMRYMLSLRRTAKEADAVVRQLCRSGIAVTDVYVLVPSDAARSTTLEDDETGNGGGTGEPPFHMVELLSDDCVVQVVQVMKETVHMRFCAGNGASAKKRASSSVQAAAATEAQSAEETFNSISIAAPPAVVAVGGAACDGPALPSRDEPIKNAAAFGCVSDAVSDTAQESSSPPVAARQRSKKTAHKVNSTGADSSLEEEEENEAWQGTARSIVTLREREAQCIRWGPAAHKHFAANYVSSPQKIMIDRFKCGRRPPPVVQLHPTQTPSSVSSQSSVSEVPSPRSSGDSRGTTETGGGRRPPRPVIAQEGSTKEHLRYQRHEPRQSPQLPSKHHRCDTYSYAHSESSSVQRAHEVLTPSAATRFQYLQVTAAPSVPAVEEMLVATEVTTAERQLVSPSHARQDAFLCSAETPVDAAARLGTSPWAPRTVAKPAVAVVARQLSFDEDGDTAPKRSLAVTDYSGVTPLGGVRRMVQG